VKINSKYGFTKDVIFKFFTDILPIPLPCYQSISLQLFEG